jgi:hypothetical protein
VVNTDDLQVMRQEAPYPTVLAEMVRTLRYKPGWCFTLNDITRGQGSLGLTLIINIHTVDSYNPEQHISVNHYMPVPPAAYDYRSWRRWLFDQILLVERHEACEFFRFPVAPRYDLASDSHYAQPDDRPYAPSHGPGSDPYLVRELGTDLDQRTSFRGEVNTP